MLPEHASIIAYQGHLSLLNVPLRVVGVDQLDSTSAILLTVNATLLDILRGLMKVLRTNGASCFKVTTLLLRSKSGGDHDTDDNDSRSHTHDRSVSRRWVAFRAFDYDTLGSGVNNLSRRRRDHISELVGNTNERGAESGWRQFAEMDGNNSPSTLDEELNHEARRRETALSGRKNPCRNEAAGYEGSENNSSATSEPLRGVPQDCSANASASLHQNRGTSSTLWREVLGLLHERGVAVLAGVTVKVEPCHQEDTVDTHAPLFLQHLLRLGPESTRSLARFASFLCFDELLRLRKENTNEADGDREASADPKYRLPGFDGIADTQISTRGENVAEGVTLLKDTAHQTTSVGSKSVSLYQETK